MARMPKPPAFWGLKLDRIDPEQALQDVGKTYQEGWPQDRVALPRKRAQGIFSDAAAGGGRPPEQARDREHHGSRFQRMAARSAPRMALSQDIPKETGMTDDEYQKGRGQVSLPNVNPDGIFGPLFTPQEHWTPEKSSLNILFGKDEIHDMLKTAGASPEQEPAPQPSKGFYSGLRPYTPDPGGPVHAGINENGYVP